eukprot:3518833-Rhodomonas_salina.1
MGRGWGRSRLQRDPDSTRYASSPARGRRPSSGPSPHPWPRSGASGGRNLPEVCSLRAYLPAQCPVLRQHIRICCAMPTLAVPVVSERRLF